MKQLQFVYDGPKQLGDLLQRLGKFRGNRPMKLLFHVYSEQSDFTNLEYVCNSIVEAFPDSFCVGGSCSGSVANGVFYRKAITVCCTVLEQESSRVGILHYGLNEESADAVAEDLVQAIEKRPWIKAVELLVATPGFSFSKFCGKLGKIRKGVQVFGGVVGSVGDDSSYVFSNKCGFTTESVVCLLYGGDDLHVLTDKVSGWRPLGKPFLVTKAQGNVLWELDGRPAFEAYSKYLNIQNDYYFRHNTLEFPLFYSEDGEYLLRAPLACSEEGALLLASDITTGTSTRITYGDPQVILDSVKVSAAKMSSFVPDAIYMYSSQARRTFWGDAEIIKETLPFDSLAPTHGSFGSGQFLRARDAVKLHNVSIVVVGMREGEADSSKIKVNVASENVNAGKVSVISRLAHFTNVSSAELVEMYNTMTKNSITDALTGLYNRGEIQRRIAERFAEYPNAPVSLVMIDIDNFKSVNDTYGHKAGDIVIQGLSKQIQSATFENAPDADAGRWGGEEFMIMLPDMGLQEAMEFAEAVRQGFAQIVFPEVGKKTISLGATELRKGDSVDAICVRVDDALYKAKNTGKNKVVPL
ncbi:MAG: GGDEF domain-containing protein [Fibrobacter sp.]|nr:GGDEF domain-containing protein [Fibrobacter sp.]